MHATAHIKRLPDTSSTFRRVSDHRPAPLRPTPQVRRLCIRPATRMKLNVRTIASSTEVGELDLPGNPNPASRAHNPHIEPRLSLRKLVSMVPVAHPTRCRSRYVFTPNLSTQRTDAHTPR